MTLMLNALKRAGLVSEKQAISAEEEIKSENKKSTKTKRHELWKSRACKNRFKDVATFEIWNKSSRPPGYLNTCALCGVRDTYLNAWDGPDRRDYNICDDCVGHEADKTY